MGRLGAGNGAGDMTKAVYDANEDDVVDDSEKLEASTKAQVQDHTPKAHTLDSHSTKAHSELSDAPEGAHHTKFTTTEHTTIGNGAPHHSKYTDANARAAAVSNIIYGAGWNGVTTIAPSKNAVYDKIDSLAGGAALTLVNTEVFSGNSPASAAWTNLDLSAVVGSNAAFVILRVRVTGGYTIIGTRPNGETEVTSTNTNFKPLSTRINASSFSFVLALTDSAGIIEWYNSYTNDAMTIDVIGYIK